MKDIRVDGRLQRVFILKETESHYVYITLKHLSRVDYNRLREIEEKGGEMLNEMRKTKLDNGRNALALYDSIIQVSKKTGPNNAAVRVRKPHETKPELTHQIEAAKQAAVVQQVQEQPVVETTAQPEQVAPEPEEKPTKRRGRPPKAQD